MVVKVTDLVINGNEQFRISTITLEVVSVGDEEEAEVAVVVVVVGMYVCMQHVACHMYYVVGSGSSSSSSSSSTATLF